MHSDQAKVSETITNECEWTQKANFLFDKETIRQIANLDFLVLMICRGNHVRTFRLVCLLSIIGIGLFRWLTSYVATTSKAMCRWTTISTSRMAYDEIWRTRSGKERKKRERERKSEREAVEGTNMANRLKSNAPALRPSVRELARRWCARCFDIDDIRSITLFSFPFFSSLSFFPIPSFFYRYLPKPRRRRKRTNLASASVLGENRSNADLRFFAQNHRWYHHRRTNPFDLPVTQVENG